MAPFKKRRPFKKKSKKGFKKKRKTVAKKHVLNPIGDPKFSRKAARINPLGGARPEYILKGMAGSVRVRMPYHLRVLLGDASNVPFTYLFRLNSTFDPDLTGSTANQPRGRDALAARYQNYVVVGANIYVQFRNAGTAVAFVGIVVSDDANTHISATDINSIDQIWENRHVKFKTIRAAAEDTTEEIRTVRAKVDLNKWKEAGETLLESFQAAVGANPSNLAPILKIFGMKEDGTALASSAIIAHVNIEFDTIFFNPSVDMNS